MIRFILATEPIQTSTKPGAIDTALTQTVFMPSAFAAWRYAPHDLVGDGQFVKQGADLAFGMPVRAAVGARSAVGTILQLQEQPIFSLASKL